MKRVVIVGGGITGLSTAVNVREKAAAAGAEIDVLVLEASAAPGGNIRTERVDGYIIENGPNGFLDNAPRTPELVDRIGLRDQVQKADESAANRYLYRNGRLHPVPTGPLSFLRSGVLSLFGRLRVFMEPFAKSRPETDETVYDFAARRIGPEAASVLVDAMVSGIFAGDVRKLSLQSAFPKMAGMEAEYGGLVKAMIGRMKAKKAARQDAEERRARGEDVEEMTRPGGPAGPGGTLTSFRNGLDTFIDGLVAAVGEDRIRTDSPVASVTRAAATPSDASAADEAPTSGDQEGSGDRPWTVMLKSGEEVGADAVVVTIPSPRAAPLLEDQDPVLSDTVAAIDTAGLAVVALAYDAADVPDANGFGFLVPRGEDLRILGCLWDSSVFPGRAPEGKVLLRCMIGGAHDPEAVTAPEEELLARCQDDVKRAMGITAEPELTRVYRWPLGIGQYHVGHQDRLDAIHGRLAESPGLWVAGSSYYGVAMNACVEKAWDQADEIVGYLTG